MLDSIHAKMAALDKQATRLQKKLGIAPKGTANIQRQLAQQQKLTKQQFQDSLKASKLQLAVDQNKLKLQSVQAKASTLQAKQAQAEHKARLGHIKAEQAAQTFSMRQEQSRLRLAQEQNRLAASNSRLEATRARTQAAADRARITGLRLEERLSKSLPRSLQGDARRPSRSIASPWRGGSRGFGSSMSHVLAGGAGVGVGASIPGLAMFSAGLHPAAIAIGAVATAATLAAAKLNQLAKQDVKALDERKVERANFKVATGSPEAAAKAEARLSALADDLGIVRSEIAKPYTMATVNLAAAGMSPDEAAKMLQGLLSFGRGAGVSTDDQAGALRAIQQSLSKGQLMSEEARQQLAERLPGAWQAMADSWAQLTKSGLVGDKASQAFSDAMEDRQIRGDKLVEFWKVFGARLQEQANAGGRLDEIRQSADAHAARLQNMKEARSIATAEFDDGRLKKASNEMLQAREKLEKSLNKLVPTFSSLESASLRFEQRFYELSSSFVEWLAMIQTKLDSFEPSPEFLRFVEAVDSTLQKFYVALEPVLTLLSDVVTFMAGIAIDTLTESWKTFFGTFADGLDSMQGLLDTIPDAVQQFVDHIRNMIAKLLDMVGLGDRWRKHQQEREQGRQIASNVEQQSKLPFMSAPITPELQRSISQLSGPSQALQNAIDNKTVNTTGVLQFNPIITVHAENADAAEVVTQLESKLQGMAQDAYRGMLQQTLDKAKTSLVQTKK
ncbi:tape measure protein [Ectopseudomonas hydrolytica]|uniref:Tape measure protein n=1 Tax=Ectopseudomonas hydrolytica TaxID=2493633 RepID=A0ABY5A4Q2_9GAMM|nr:tape measure protein [Pseudomonas hydrolytica]USR38356.1 tape measure protein [Pseudomonas hydrolytica]